VARTYYANAATSTENDEFTYIDGVLSPQIHGNGTEDDYCQGWNGWTYNKPLWGALTYGYQNAYRIYLGERYVFYNHIKIQNEGRAVDPAKMEVSQVVYYYKKADGLTGLLLTDSVDVGNQASEQAHSYSISKQTWTGTTSDHYDGYMDDINYYARTDDGRAFNGYSQFKVKINPNNRGVKLRKRLNTGLNGRQRANVYVDSILIDRPWQITTASNQSGMQCWRDDDFEIPDSLTNGKDSITIKIEYVASPQYGSINEYFYWVMSYSPEGSVPSMPPAAPSDLSAVALTYSSIKLSWSNNSNQFADIIIERKTDTTDFVLIALTDQNITSYIDTGLASATKYIYQIKAANYVGYSAYSGSDSAVTLNSPSNITNEKNIDKILVYPNPCQNSIFTIEAGTQHVTVSICDIQGKCIFFKILNSGIYKYDGLKLNKGLYLLSITTSYGIQTFKLISN
jgi:hypothetical protein